MELVLILKRNKINDNTHTSMTSMNVGTESAKKKQSGTVEDRMCSTQHRQNGSRNPIQCPDAIMSTHFPQVKGRCFPQVQETVWQGHSGPVRPTTETKKARAKRHCLLKPQNAKEFEAQAPWHSDAEQITAGGAAAARIKRRSCDTQRLEEMTTT